MEFDCKTELPGGGGECETQDECYANYSKGIEAVAIAKAAVVEEEDDDVSAVVIVVVVLLVVIALVVLLFICTKYRVAI